MGNCDGNVSVVSDRSNSSEMLKLSDMSKILFFPPQEDSSSNMVKRGFTDNLCTTSPIFTTKVRGQVIAFPTQSYSKLAEIVDLRVEKANSDTEEPVSPNLSAKISQAASSSDNGMKLKFGIDSILNSDPSTKTEKTCRSSQDTKTPFNSSPVKNSLEGRKSGTSPNLEISKRSSFHHGKNNSAKEEKLRTTPFSILRSAHHNRHHPYSKLPFERSHSDPATSQAKLPERIRRRSESPQRSAFPFCSFSEQKPSTVTEIHSKRFENNELCANPVSARLSETSSSKPTNFSPSCFQPTFKKSFPTSQGFAMHNSFKLSHIVKGSHRHSETDEVFGENSEENQKIAAAKNFEQILKQRHLLASSPTSHPSSPTAASPMEKQKFSPMGMFPSMNQHHLNPFQVPAPSTFNLQSWQNLPANCHPALFRHFLNLNPYMYNQTAAAAVALSYFQSLKSVPHQSMMVPDGFRMNKTSSKPSFGFRSSDSDMHTNAEKQCGMKNKRRKWTRAVFSILQRRALEDSFKGQKYVAKPERRFLAERLGLTDAQVKIWFQNRRMKWRQEQKTKLSVGAEDMSPPSGEENFRQLQAHS